MRTGDNIDVPSHLPDSRGPERDTSHQAREVEEVEYVQAIELRISDRLERLVQDRFAEQQQLEQQDWKEYNLQRHPAYTSAFFCQGESRRHHLP